MEEITWKLELELKNNTSEAWTTRTSAADIDWYGVCWSPELMLFVAVASSGTGTRVMTSPDGITWTSRTSAADNNWRSVCWSPELSLFAAVSTTGTGNRVMTSPDGITWTIRTSAASIYWTSVCWSPELLLFVAVAATGTGNRVMTSPDGITWTTRTSAADNEWYSVCWSPELTLFVAVAVTGTGNRVMTSPDGITWTIRTSAADNNWRSVCWSPELTLFAAVAATGTGNRVMTSPDGITWTSRTSAADNDWRAVCWSPELKLFVAVSSSGTGNRVMTSPDGITWTIRTSAADNNWYSVCWSYGLGRLVAVGISGTNTRVMSEDSYTDFTNYVTLMGELIEITDGMQSTSLVDVMANPGAINWTFDNSPANPSGLAGYFSPGHTNCRSGYEKGIRVRFSELYDGTRYYQGVYWLKTITPTPGLFGEGLTRCQATDWLELAMREPLPPIGVQTNKRADELITILRAKMTTKPASIDFDIGDSTFASSMDIDNVSRDSVYSVLGKIARSEYGRIYLQPSTTGGGVLTFENRNARLANITSLGTISDVMDSVSVMDDAGQVCERFQVKITPRRVDTGLEILAALNYYLYLGPGEERTFTMEFIEQTSGNRISGTNIQTQVAGTDYKFGSAGDGTTQDLNANLGVTVVSNGGNSCVRKVKNNGAAPGYLNLFQLRGYGIYPYNPYTVEAGSGGMRMESLEMPYQNNPNTADAVANYLQTLSSDNSRRGCRVNIHANKSAALMLAAMTGLISTRWTIAETQIALSGDFFINGRRRTISLGNRLDVEWLMVPAGNSLAWVLDTSALDTSTVLTV